MDDLLELALRCERATGDSFDLNHAIAKALGIASEPFTASLDAAMTLVPEGWLWLVQQWANGGSAECASTMPYKLRGRYYAATPALALCAAALRARAQGNG